MSLSRWSSPRRIAALGVVAGAVLLGAAAGVRAQEATGHLNPPVPHRADPTPPTMWNYFAAIVILGAVAVANAIPSKRGHQD